MRSNAVGRRTIYVAGASSEWEMVQKYIKALRGAGLHITHDWTEQVAAARAADRSDRDYSKEERRAYAEDDVNGVLRARLFWVLAPEGASTGAWVELGLALHDGKIVIVSGDAQKCIFADLADFSFKTHEEAFGFLTREVRRG